MLARRVVPLTLAALGLAATALAAGRVVDRITLPPGFTLEVFADDLPGARSLALSPAGTLFVASRDKGVVYAIPGAGGAARAAKPRIVARGLDSANGVAVRDGALYVAEISRILRLDNIEARLDRPPAPVVVTDRYPRDQIGRAHV